MTSKVLLHVSNQRAFVWDIQHLETVRAKHHICGLLIGTLPHLSQQNVFLGVPLVLMPEEVVLLVQKGLAVLVDDSKAHHAPSANDLEIWAERRGQELKSQLARLEDATNDVAASKSTSEVAVQKRREREAKRAAARAQAALLSGEDPISAPPLESIAPQEVNETSTSTQVYAVMIPATSADLPWHDSESHSYNTIAAAKEAGIWSYPANLHERAKCGVFQDLWEKGYFMGGGMRFGGDYLVYPGDPLRYHSHFVASVIDSPTSALQPMEIVAHGRLGTATKKAHLLCGWDDDAKVVSYHSIEWAGFG